MNTDIRLQTRCVIERDGEYLVGYCGALGTRWSNSPYDAWFTRDKMEAFHVAWEHRGRVLLFNPVIGKTAPMRQTCMEGAAAV